MRQLEEDTKWPELDKTSNVRYGTAGVKVEANSKVKAAESETAQQEQGIENCKSYCGINCSPDLQRGDIEVVETHETEL